MMKRKWIITIVLLAAAAVGYLYLHFNKGKDFEPPIKAKLASLVSKASNGLYQLNIERIEIDITNGSVIAKNILLQPDSARMLQLEKEQLLADNIYSISLKQLNLRGLSPLDLLDEKNIDLNLVRVDSPDIKIVHKKRGFQKKDTATLYERIAAKGQSYSIDNLLLQHIHLSITDLDRNKQVSTFKDLSASFTGIQIDSATKNDSTRFLFAKDAVIFMKGYKVAAASNKYHFTIDSVALKPQAGSLELFNINLRPIGTKDEFSAKLQYMDDRFDIQLHQAAIKNINWFSVLAQEGFYGDKMTITGGHINVYDDRRLPQGPAKEGRFPHQLLTKLKFPVNIPLVLLRNLTISYEEFNPKAGQTGTVSFYDVNGEMNNVTNTAAGIAANGMLSIKAVANFMNAGTLNAGFNFNLRKATAGDFSVDATLGATEGTRLNKLTQGLALLTIKQLHVDELNVQMKGSNAGTSGRLKFAYHDLAFDVLKPDDEGLKKRSLLTFITSNFIVKKSNPSSGDKQLRVYPVSHKRDPQRSFFNLIWKTILDGIMKTVKGKK